MSLYKLVCVLIWATATGTKISLGGVCTVGRVPCKTDHAECSGSVCRCLSGYHQTVDNTCVEKISLGGVCTVGRVPCKTDHAECSGSVCMCLSGYHQTVANTCVENSPTKTITGTVTSSATTPTSNVTATTTTESTSSPLTSSTTGITPQSTEPNAAFLESSRGSSTAATAAGVSVAVALAVAAVVIVFVLRKKEKLCFAVTRGSKLENPDNNNHISLARIESKPNAHYQSPLALGESEAHNYNVLEKDGFEDQRNDIISVPADVHDYFVLEKQKPAIDNGTGVSINEIHTYFVLETQGGQPAQEMPLNESNHYFVLEKETTGNPGPKHTAHALEVDKDDRDMYQEIDSNDTYADIDDLQQDNNNYDNTNKAFTDSKTDLSNNVYNHLNSAGDEYDHVGKGQNNVETI